MPYASQHCDRQEFSAPAGRAASSAARSAAEATSAPTVVGQILGGMGAFIPLTGSDSAAALLDCAAALMNRL
jgi:hypothetical protein